MEELDFYAPLPDREETKIEVRPRIWAAKILAADGQVRKLDIFNQVPAHLQPLVKKHVQLIMEKRKHLNGRLLAPADATISK